MRRAPSALEQSLLLELIRSGAKRNVLYNEGFTKSEIVAAGVTVSLERSSQEIGGRLLRSKHGHSAPDRCAAARIDTAERASSSVHSGNTGGALA